tara:strand:+ start:1545 stop:1778 length:234 start_codon:yes stop_codon:yes gene_type:complete
METESYTLKMGITVSGTKQYESIRIDVSETVTLDSKEQADDQIKQYSFRQLRKGLKLKILESVADAKEVVALSRGKA